MKIQDVEITGILKLSIDRHSELTDNIYLIPQNVFLILLSVSDCYCSQLPPFCDTLMLRTYGAVLDEIELDKKDIACVFIPIIPKMKINTFFIDATQGTANHKNMSAKVQDWIAKNSGFGKNEKSKCVMVFSDGDNYTLATKILESIKYK